MWVHLSYQCDCYGMKRRAGRSDDTRHRSTPKADYDSDTVARSNLDVNQHVQLWSIRTDSECTNRQIGDLVDIVWKLSDKIMILRKDSENLNIRVDHISVSECCCRMSAIAGATCHEASPSAAKVNKTRSYWDVLITGSISSIWHSAYPNNPGDIYVTSSNNLALQAVICDYGFTTVVKTTGNK
jgi:hypothetical protein